MTIAVKLSGLRKSYGALDVLKELDLSIKEGSFTSLLGPSGCGKTTLLNIIGGLDQPTGGEVQIGSDLVYSEKHAVNTPTEKRNLGFVFQSYALWPHMTVLQNVGYSLKIRRIPKEERNERSREMLKRLELEMLADRYPYQLSGGQQQRVAIARALVYRPRLLLLDEPLSNLDAQLRERARAWLKNVHEQFNLTTILVTHDQVEALSLSDEVVLINKGRIEQFGTADEIYVKPRTAYVADFVGGANIITGKIVSSLSNGAETAVVLETADGTRVAARAPESPAKGASFSVAVRPQKIRLVDPAQHTDTGGTLVPFALLTDLYQGAVHEIIGTTPFGSLRVFVENKPEPSFTHAFLPAQDCLCVTA
ncbi:MAG: transporter related protein [Hyphomicrobiales bacterium]|nr:transporter related protein [Hyphomicrobiales bacterium]